MSSFSLQQVRSFAEQGARQRAMIFGDGTPGGSPTEPNFQIGEVSGTTTTTWGRSFRCAFTRLANVVEVLMHGKTVNCTAKIAVMKSLGLTFTEATLFKHLPTGDIYDVAQIGVDNASFAETPVLLHRREA